MGLAIPFFLCFKGVLFLGGSFPPLTLYHTSCQVSRSNLCSAIFLYLISGCPLNLGSRRVPTYLVATKGAGSWSCAGRIAPPQPPILLLYHKELRLVKYFYKKNFFIFFIYIPFYYITFRFRLSSIFQKLF